MVATVNWKGFGKVTNADTLTNWSTVKITAGGGTPSAALADGFIEGAAAITTTSNAKRILLYYDIGAGNELDFSGGGTEEGEMVYVWGNMISAALLQTQATGGFGIFLESSTPTTTQYHLWYFYGSDNYAGGWKRMVLDPTETVSASAGTAIDLSAVRYFGIFADTTATARFDNMICDAIDVGTGIRVTGTSTTDDLVGDLLADEATNSYGIVQALNDSNSAVELNGQLDLGDNVGTTATTLTDLNSKIFLSEPLYYDGTSITTSVPSTFFNINCVGNATGATDISVGAKVGTGDTATGRNGWSLVGNASYAVGIDFDDGNVNNNKWYGTSLENLTGTLSWGTNTAHEMMGCSLTNCSEFDSVGGIIQRNNNFVGTADDGTTKYASMIWNGSIDIKNCNFIANTDPDADVSHAIHHDTAGTFAYDGLVFSGNEKDVWFSATTGNLIITGTDGSPTSTNDSTGTVTFPSSVQLTMTVKDEAGAVVVGANAYIDDNNLTPFILNTTTNGSGVATIRHTGGAVTGATWRIRKYGYKPYKAIIDIGAVDISIPVTLVADPQQT